MPGSACCRAHRGAQVQAGTLAAVPLTTDELVRPLGIIHRRGKDLGVTVRRLSNCCAVRMRSTRYR